MDIKKNSGNKKAAKTIRMLKEVCITFVMITIILFILKHLSSLALMNKEDLGSYLYYILIAIVFCFLLVSIEKPDHIVFDGFFHVSFDRNIALKETFRTPGKAARRISKTKKRAQFNKEKPLENKNLTSIAYLDEIFADFDDNFLQNAPIQTISILSYFATSLFEKNNVDEVLWDIVENCISHLYLEDCVVYMFDKEKQYLIQKASFGDKNNGEKKVVSPIKIKKGEGIVGSVAKSGKYQCIKDVTKNPAYILDDAPRMSELSVPIFIEDNIVGVLDSEHSEKDFFTNDHIFLFHLIAKLTEKKLKQICSNVSSHINNDNKYFKELDFLMQEAKIYRDPYLGLDSMAKKLKISGNYLSQLVNKLSGHNFTDYVNGYRIEDAKSKLRNPKFINYTIISIALESGFNSKSTFYSAFKKRIGVSPKEYRKTS
ncbi:helix-turn-helix domain-containing protein [Aquimarina sediminis]|uniref:helix-turn-helix domain-containing protein n=1 Tax=Aquimarina sediminis TaxID=2070536 RepID=UPI000CA03514|nr:helix-turn-helix domain-containing protein [Aquimarina sediminis]